MYGVTPTGKRLHVLDEEGKSLCGFGNYPLLIGFAWSEVLNKYIPIEEPTALHAPEGPEKRYRHCDWCAERVFHI